MQHYLIDGMIYKLQKPMTHSRRYTGVPYYLQTTCRTRCIVWVRQWRLERCHPSTTCSRSSPSDWSKQVYTHVLQFRKATAAPELHAVEHPCTLLLMLLGN